MDDFSEPEETNHNCWKRRMWDRDVTVDEVLTSKITEGLSIVVGKQHTWDGDVTVDEFLPGKITEGLSIIAGK
jgi:D-Tyr-tRNAtyr deacylase